MGGVTSVQNGALLCDATNFEGNCAVVGPGRFNIPVDAGHIISSTGSPVQANALSSIRAGENATVTVYDGPDFHSNAAPHVIPAGTAVSDLKYLDPVSGDWNDAIESVSIALVDPAKAEPMSQTTMLLVFLFLLVIAIGVYFAMRSGDRQDEV